MSPGRTSGSPPCVSVSRAHSRRFHFGPDAEAQDEDRDIAAARCGWELLYLGWYAAKRPVEVLDIVKDVVEQRRIGFGEL